MAQAVLTDRDFMRLFKTMGASKLSKKIGVAERAVFSRRTRLEGKYGEQITGPQDRTRSHIAHPGRLEATIKDGYVLVGSDGHYWPGLVPTAHRAFVAFCKEYKPGLVILNGDSFDGSTISRHPPMNWEDHPTVQEELEAVQERHAEIEQAAGRARKIWNLGNHDARFETRLATVAPEYAKVFGMHLRDHFPLWEPGWSTWINDEAVVKHRFKGGVHATHNNTLNSGKTTVTSHLHSLKVTPLDDYNGTRWGVDTGCLADPHGPQFEYTEDNPRNHRSGFAVLKFIDGRLLWPELVYVIDENHVGFRGEIITV